MSEADTKTKPIKFLCYRYAVIPNAQMSLWTDTNFEKRQVMQEVIQYCAEKGPYSAKYSGIEAVLLYMRSIGETAHLFKFCKKQRVRRYEIELDRSDVAERDYDSYPYAYVIVDTSYQVVLIQRKSTVFKNAGGAKASFASLVKQFLSDDNYYFSLDEITTSTSFWDAIEHADGVYDVTFKLKSPNFLGTGYKTTDTLKRVQRATNNDRLTLQLANSAGELDMSRKEFGDTVDYITDGGGSWTMTTSSGGSRRVTHKSDEFVKTTEITVSESRPLDDGEVVEAIREVGAKRGDKHVSSSMGS